MLIQNIDQGLRVSGMFVKNNILQEIACIHEQIEGFYKKNVLKTDLSDRQIQAISKKTIKECQSISVSIDQPAAEAAFNIRRDIKRAIQADIKLDAMTNSVLQNCAITKLAEVRKKVDKLFPDLEARIETAIRTELK